MLKFLTRYFKIYTQEFRSFCPKNEGNLDFLPMSNFEPQTFQMEAFNRSLSLFKRKRDDAKIRVADIPECLAD